MLPVLFQRIHRVGSFSDGAACFRLIALLTSVLAIGPNR